MSSDLNEVKSVSLSEEGSVGDRLGYEKQGRECPGSIIWRSSGKQILKEISSRLSIPYDETEKKL